MAPTPLPQLAGGLFLSDGGLETSLIDLDGTALPQFAAFVLLHSAAGREQLRRDYRPYLELAAATAAAGFVLESPTWRANADWGRRLGIDDEALARANRCRRLRSALPQLNVLGGCCGIDARHLRAIRGAWLQ